MSNPFAALARVGTAHLKNDLASLTPADAPKRVRKVSENSATVSAIANLSERIQGREPASTQAPAQSEEADTEQETEPTGRRHTFPKVRESVGPSASLISALRKL